MKKNTIVLMLICLVSTASKCSEVYSKKHITETLYKTQAYLKDRTSVYRYQTNPESVFNWAWKFYTIAPGSHILEVGAGLGNFWVTNIKKLPDVCRLTLTDIAYGMLDSCKNNLEPFVGSHTINFMYADIEQLPFPSNSFDFVLVHFLLYYTESPLRALAEVKRVLKPGGTASIFTLHSASKHEIYEFGHQIDPQFPIRDQAIARFCEENADSFLDEIFPQRTKAVYTTDIVITSSDEIMRTVCSIDLSDKLSLSDKFYTAYQDAADAIIREKGSFYLKENRCALYICKK